MERKVKIKSPDIVKMRDTGKKPEKISHEVFASAMGAEKTNSSINSKTGAISLLALRQELSEKLNSKGGRPSLENTTKRQKIPMSEADWRDLENVAEELKKSGVTVSAGQVASMLIKQSLRNLKDGKLADIKELV
jgi:hypothetical protein